MPGVASRDKGKRGEREVCKLLQEWWNKDGVIFERTPQSGAWDRNRRFSMCGDIICNDPSFPYCVEVKFNEKFSLDQIFMNKGKGDFFKWWEQCIHQAQQIQKQPLLIVRKRFFSWFIFTTKENTLKLDNFISIIYNKLNIVGFNNILKLIKFNKKEKKNG